MTLAAVLLRGHIKMNKQHRDTLKMLGLKKINTVVLLPENQIFKGMLKKVEGFVAWGEMSKELEHQLSSAKRHHVKPPKKGFKSLKKHYPKGNLGYNGSEINNLIKRMT